MQLLEIGDYLDRARARLKIDSDNKLGLVLGVSGAFLSEVRRKRKWPSDEVMLRLADLAETPRNQALLDLNRWRAPADGKAREVYADMIRKLVAALVIGIGLSAALAAPSPARAGVNPERINPNPLCSIDYGKY